MMVVAAVGRVLAVGCELWSEMWSVAGRQLMPERGPAGNRLHCIALHLQMLPRGCVLLSLVTRQRLAPPWTSGGCPHPDPWATQAFCVS
jgi:hypothetical protein